ncbi:pilus assembly protein TadG-related protein [Pseudogemmobacter bohemicus]|uniref:pilus assembly protein TadG-related protein n=1 Tax=Pseudogemmobacter bohemicus TaxID=2250708 RepID=UPI000DD4CC15|nr:pilus assembly protein TadG-related protein [Pseudogemmobacter bohemicus]
MIRFPHMGALRRWLADTTGSVTIFFVVIFPLLMLIGGLATDAVRLNAQKRYTQSQADLAAHSAARFLPDPVRVRAIARRVVAVNALYGQIQLQDSDILLGSFTAVGGFVPHPDQASPTGASAVMVKVPSRYRPLLLGPVMRDENVVIRRSAVAGQKGGVVVFTLRNRLLGVNTRESILDPVLSGLGIGLNVSVLSYEGLANTRVKVEELLSLLSLGLAAEVFTFNDVLHLPLTGPRLFSGLSQAGGLPSGALPPLPHGGQPVTLAEVMSVSPSLLEARIGDVLPDVTVNAYDLMMAFLGLAADPEERLDIGTGLNLAPLANVGLKIGLVRPPVIGIGRIGDDPPPRASVSQVDVALGADVLGEGNGALLRVALNVGVGTADAVALSLNCGASEPSDQLALFRAETAPVELALRIGLLDSRPGVAPADMGRVSLARGVKDVPIRLDQFRQPVPVRNPLTLSGLVADVGTFLDTVSDDLQAQVDANACAGGLLSLLICPLFTVVNAALAALLSVLSSVISSIAWVLASLGVDAIIQSLLDLLGISVAQADLILDDYSCGTSMLQ